MSNRYRPEPVDMRGASSRQWTVWDSVTGERVAYVYQADAQGRGIAVRICVALNVMEAIDDQIQQEGKKRG